MKVIAKIIESMKDRITTDLVRFTPADMTAFNIVLNAYNRWCEDENNGNGYLFNIHNDEDLLCLVKCGMKASDIARIYEDSQYKTSGFFFCDENHDGYEQVDSYEEVCDILISMLDEICECTLVYVTRCKEYQTLYEKYITDKYLEFKDAESLRDKRKFNWVCVEIGYNPNEGLDALAELKKKMEMS